MLCWYEDRCWTRDDSYISNLLSINYSILDANSAGGTRNARTYPEDQIECSKYSPVRQTPKLDVLYLNGSQMSADNTARYHPVVRLARAG